MAATVKSTSGASAVYTITGMNGSTVTVTNTPGVTGNGVTIAATTGVLLEDSINTLAQLLLQLATNTVQP